MERRPNGNRRLHLRVEGRGGVGHELIVEMDHQTLHFSIIPPEQTECEEAAAREGIRNARRSERHELARSTMRQLGESATITELAAGMGVSYRVAWLLVRELAAEGVLEEVPPQEGGNHHSRKAPAYRLRSDENTVVY